MGYTVEEAQTVERRINQAQSWLKRALEASQPSDPGRAVLKVAAGCIREALRRFNVNRDPEWVLDALKPGDYSGSPEAARCIQRVRELCKDVIDRDA